jgi:predicted acyltransferase
MIFVNDVAGVSGAPAWMKHVSPPDADGMTFVDVVFPAFLFIVGMSIPFAIGRRLEREGSLGLLWRHILTRTLGLLVIGVFMVNSDSISDRGVLNPHLWTLLMYAGVILAWNTPPRQPGPKRKAVLGMRAAGVVGLVVMALLYRGTGEPSWIELRPQWWGILGLIGWAYLVACVAYIPLRRQPAGMVGIVALLYCVYMADSAGYFSGMTWITQWVSIGSALGSHAAITVSGVILGMILTPDSLVTTHSARIRWAVLYGLGLAAAGLLLHSLHDIHKMFIINKIFATAPWCLWSSAITIWIWVAIYWLIDIQGWKRWTVVVEPAGQNALFAYILAPILYSAFALLAMADGGFDFYGELGSSFAIGFWRSLVFAFAVTWLAGGLRRVGVQLKL